MCSRERVSLRQAYFWFKLADLQSCRVRPNGPNRRWTALWWIKITYCFFRTSFADKCSPFLPDFLLLLIPLSFLLFPIIFFRLILISNTPPVPFLLYFFAIMVPYAHPHFHPPPSLSPPFPFPHFFILFPFLLSIGSSSYSFQINSATSLYF